MKKQSFPFSGRRISEISLSEMLPNVFLNQDNPPSEVWLSQLSFCRPGLYLVNAGSGAGKSSLAAYIFGSRTDFAGTLRFDGIDTSGFTIDDWQEIRRRHIAYLPQELSLFPELTALENVQLKNRLTNHVDDKRIAQWFEKLGIADRMDYPAGRLSIGQMQRVAIIRSLCQPFDFLILDEPVSHLDINNNRIAAEIILEETRRQDAAIIATSVGNPIELPYTQQLSL